MKKISALAIAGVFTASLAATAFAEMADVKVGGEIRVRAENVKTDGSTGDAQYLQRTRINADAKINETTKAYVSLQDSRVWGAEASTTSTGNNTGEDGQVDVSQAYFQLDNLGGQPLSLRAGRQALAYGDQRLVGGLEWTNNARRFDALKLIYSTDAFSVDLWTAKLVEGVDSGLDSDFNGIYATVKTVPNNAIDLYLLQDITGKNVTDRNVTTYGLRVAGKAADLDYTAEYALQTGDNSAGVGQESSALALKAGYTLAAVAGGLRIGAEYDSATGNDAGTTDNEAFQNLYPTNHSLYGFTDDIGWSNIQAMSLNVSAKPAENLSVAAEYWTYTEAEDAGGGGDGAGTELNLLAKYALNANVKLEAAYVRRTAGDDTIAGTYDTTGVNYIDSNGLAKDDTNTFIYLQATVTF